MVNTHAERIAVPDAATELEELRAEIERIDQDIVRAVAERTRLARRIGRLKKLQGLALVHPAREAAVVRRAAEAAREHGLDDDAIREVFWRLIEMSRRAQAVGERDEG